MKKFDFIVLSHIVNNVIDAFTFIREISFLLNKNGFLLVEIKNCNSEYYQTVKNISLFLIFLMIIHFKK